MRPDAGRADLLDLSSVEAVLFDMDGMLVDSDASFKRAGGLVRRIWRRRVGRLRPRLGVAIGVTCMRVLG